jgi:transposase
MERQFKGVWIPAEVWLDKDLSLVEKALLAEIDSFTGNGKVFYKSNDTIVAEYQISKSTISRAVKKLETLGYISVESDGRNRFITSRQGSRVKMTMQGGQNDHSDKSKRRATNTIEESNYNTPKEEVSYPWDSTQFREAWQEYLDMRWAQHKFKFKTIATEQTALHKLHKISSGNERIAIAIIAESLVGCWKGLYPLKNNTYEQVGITDGSVIEAHLRNLGAQS